MTKKYRAWISELLALLSEKLNRPEIRATIILDDTELGDLIEEIELRKIRDVFRRKVSLKTPVWQIAITQHCSDIIPNTFYICGEDGQYCSRGCLEVGLLHI